MLMHLADLQDLQPTTVIFAANREHELAGAKAIRELQSALPKLRGIVTVWYPQGSSSGLTGTAADAFAAALDNCPNSRMSTSAARPRSARFEEVRTLRREIAALKGA